VWGARATDAVGQQAVRILLVGWVYLGGKEEVQRVALMAAQCEVREMAVWRRAMRQEEQGCLGRQDLPCA